MKLVQPVIYVLSVQLFGLAVLMLLCAVFGFFHAGPAAEGFVISSAMTLFVSGTLYFATRQPQVPPLSRRQAFLLTTVSWIGICVFAAIPFIVTNSVATVTDAVFEAVSGITTTGSTVMTDLDSADRAILLWRSGLQWIGGLGIVIMAIMLLPFLRVGGMQLFHTERIDRSERIVARPIQLARSIVGIYLVLTVACMVAYDMAGMDAFDAVNHAMTTVSTAGYSTRDASIGYYPQPAVLWVGIVFMIAGALPFAVYIAAVQGRPAALFTDPQIRLFVPALLAWGLVLGIWLSVTSDLPFEVAFRHALFSVTSIITTTGLVSTDYSAWGPFAAGVFLVIMFVGGCAGSTTGAVKIYRWQVLLIILRSFLGRMVMPSRIYSLSYGGRHVTEEVVVSVLAFLAVFAGSLAVFTLLLAATGLDLVTALSAAGSAISNVGPGLGTTIGPAGTFASLPDSAKWLLCAAMLLGRLEVFTVLVLFLPGFWRQ